MSHGRKRLVTVLTGLATAAVIGVVPASPSWAEPDIDEVKVQVDRLYHEAEEASERYNDARLELSRVKKELRALHADEARQQARLAEVQEQVGDSLLQQYQGQTISVVGQVVVSEDPSAFLSQLATMSSFNDLQADKFDDFAVELEALQVRSAETKARAAEVEQLTRRLGEEKVTIEKKHGEAQELLDELEAEEYRRLEDASRSGLRYDSNIAVSGRAAAAVKYALAQVGDAYVYGAAGPNSWDCSGLTMVAWAQAGVSLPHSSSAQASSGPQVSFSDLQPGDLVFYYSPISHVGLYIGGGKIVHAANPSTGVVVSGVNSMPYSGAVRPG